MVKLIVGLGNPGSEYSKTRHNVGFMALDYFHEKESLTPWKKGYKGFWTEKSFKGEKVYFLKPQTFMNLSGESAIQLASFFKIDVSEILVIHDELDISFGEIVFKQGGGAGGHNGLKSLIQHLGKPDFMRLRIGISRPPHGDTVPWVLSDFSKLEFSLLDTIFENITKSLKLCIEYDFQKAAATYSRKKLI